MQCYYQTSSFQTTNKADLVGFVGPAKLILPAQPDTMQRVKNADLSAAMAARWHKLLDQDPDLAVLYSGGIDSQLIIQTMLATQRFPKQIIFIFWDPFDGAAAYTHGDEAAFGIRLLASWQQRRIIPPTVELKTFRITADMTARLFQSDWEQLPVVNSFGFGIDVGSGWALYPDQLPVIHNTVLIRGGNTPKVFFENGHWQWLFVDSQFGDAIPRPNEINFILDDTQLLEAYVNQVIDQYEKHNHWPSLYHAYQQTLLDFDPRRTIPECAAAYQHIGPNLFKGKYRSIESDNLVERINANFGCKNWLMYLNARHLNPQWFRDYLNSNWEYIERAVGVGGVITKTTEVLE